MGWSSHHLPAEKWRLWTRGGTCGVYVKHDDRDDRDDRDEEIAIPSELLKMLVADDVRSHRISQLEGMEDNDVLGLPMDHDG